MVRVQDGDWDEDRILLTVVRTRARKKDGRQWMEIGKK